MGCCGKMKKTSPGVYCDLVVGRLVGWLVIGEVAMCGRHGWMGRETEGCALIVLYHHTVA